jgi:hypothetical protein
MDKTIKKKFSQRKYIIASAFLLIIAALVFIYFTQEQKPDPVSEKVIREITALQHNKDPNELTDEDFARIVEIDLSNKKLSNIRLLEKFFNLRDLSLNNTIFPENEIPK